MILRCTSKVLQLLGVKASAVTKPSAALPDSEDWYANLLWFDRRKCLLLTHAGTLFSVFAADVRKTGLLPIGPSVVGLIEEALRSEGLPTETLGRLDPDDVHLAKTASRSVLGCMNDMALHCEYFISSSGGLSRCDISSSTAASVGPSTARVATSVQSTSPPSRPASTKPAGRACQRMSRKPVFLTSDNESISLARWRSGLDQ